MRKSKKSNTATYKNDFNLFESDTRIVNVEFTANASLSHDPNYGADADGNRGIPQDFIDDMILDPKSIEISYEYNGKEKTIKFENLSSRNQEHILEVIEQVMSDDYNVWSKLEFEVAEPDYSYDDRY